MTARSRLLRARPTQRSFPARPELERLDDRRSISKFLSCDQFSAEMAPCNADITSRFCAHFPAFVAWLSN
jgi:hypothetical protein